MIDKECAAAIRDHALNAVSQLSLALKVSGGRCSEASYEQIRRGVGLAIGKIQTDLLDVLYAEHPELDDLRPGGAG